MSVQGPIPVEFGTVFPAGAYAAGAFDPVRNFDASTGESFRPVPRQGHRGAAVGDRGHRPRPGRAHPGGQGQGRRPGPAGRPHGAVRVAVRPVEFTGTTVTPYVNQAGRLADLLKVTGIRDPAAAAPDPNQGGDRMRSGGGSFGQISLHVGQDWWTFLNTYDDDSPILDAPPWSTTVTSPSPTARPSDSAPEFAGCWPARRRSSPPRSSDCTPRTAWTAARARPVPGAVRPP